MTLTNKKCDICEKEVSIIKMHSDVLLNDKKLLICDDCQRKYILVNVINSNSDDFVKYKRIRISGRIKNKQQLILTAKLIKNKKDI